MNILYLHGYASRYKPDSEKVRALENLGTVSGIDLDYTKGPETVIEAAVSAWEKYDIDLITGTSMGGWLASHTGVNTGTPFVGLNPAINPGQSLIKHIGKPVRYPGNDITCTIDAQTVAEYPPIALNGCALILCQEGDTVIDPHTTVDTLKDYYDVQLLPGGSHRFEGLESHLDEIQALYIRAAAIYGLVAD